MARTAGGAAPSEAMTTVAERIGDRTVGGALRARAGAAALALPVFAATIALSAFLLFTVEPLVGRLTLPTFGGTPAVWATVLFFFQTVLLAGYAYGHVSATWLGPRRGAIVHVVLALAAVAALAVAPVRIGDLRDVGLPAVVNLVWILLVTIGAPALLITATTPLLSSWLAAIRAADGEPADTYWLYALSNAGIVRRAPRLPVPDRAGPRTGRATDAVGRRHRDPHRLPGGLRGAGPAAGARDAARDDPIDRAPPPAPAARAPGRGRPRGADRLAPPRPLAPARRHTLGPPVGRDQLHHHRPHLRAAPVGGAAGDLPADIRDRLLRARPAAPARRRVARPGRDHPALGAVRIGRRLADRTPPRARVRRTAGSWRRASTGAWPRIGRRPRT